MKKIVLDASVAVKWFPNEEFTDKIILVRDAFLYGSIFLYAPEYILCEISNSV